VHNQPQRQFQDRRFSPLRSHAAAIAPVMRPHLALLRLAFGGLALSLATVVLVPAFAIAAPWGFLVSADGKTRKPLDKPQVTIGSAAGSDVLLTDRTVSKKHAVIVHKQGVVTIEDRRSKLGTLVAGTPLRRGRKMQLFQRTQLTFGAVTWTFVWGQRKKIIAPLRASKKAPKKALKHARSGKGHAAKKPLAKAKSKRGTARASTIDKKATHKKTTHTKAPAKKAKK